MNEDQDRQTTEVRDTSARQGDTTVHRQTVATSRAVGGNVILRRIIWYIAGIIIAFLAVRIILLLLAANQGNAFVDFVYAVGGWFATPFYGIFSYQPSYGHSTLEISSIVAIIVYALVATGLARLAMLTSSRDDVV